MDPAAFKTFLIAISALALNLFLLTFLTVTRRASAKAFPNSEDAKAFKGEEVTEEAVPVHRIQKAHRNALENFVPFAILAGLYVGTGANPLHVQIYCYTFVAARWLHSIFYIKSIQPFRTLMFVLGFLCNIGITVQLLIHAFS